MLLDYHSFYATAQPHAGPSWFPVKKKPDRKRLRPTAVHAAVQAVLLALEAKATASTRPRVKARLGALLALSTSLEAQSTGTVRMAGKVTAGAHASRAATRTVLRVCATTDADVGTLQGAGVSRSGARGAVVASGPFATVQADCTTAAGAVLETHAEALRTLGYLAPDDADVLAGVMVLLAELADLDESDE